MSKIHARYSPSRLDLLSQCCRFLYIESDGVNEAAEEGTALHFSVETHDLRGLDENQSTAVQKCLDYMASLRAGVPTGFYELKEPKLVLEGLTFGHADNVIISEADKTIRITDYKFGRLEGSYDFQTTTYAACAVEMLRSEKGMEVSPGVWLKMRAQRVETHVLAPRQEGPPTLQEHDAQELLVRVRERITNLYAVIDDPFSPPTPDANLCSKCARAAVCPAVTQIVRQAAPYLGLPLPEVFEPQSMVSVKDRALAHQLAQLFENWSELVKKGNTEFVRNGGEIPGFKMTQRSTGFKVPRDQTLTALNILKEKMGLDLELVAGALTLSVTELAASLAAVTPTGEKETKAQLMELLGGVGMSGSCQFLTKLSKADKAKKELN